MANLADHAQNGFDEVTGTENGDWIGFLVIGSAGATLSATTATGDNLSSIALSEGVYIGGMFTTLTVTAGTILATRRNQA